MNKKNRIVFIALLAMVAAPSFAAEPKPPAETVTKADPAHFREYVPEDRSYTMLYPADWKVVPGKGPLAVSFVNPKTIGPGKAAEFVSLTIVSSKGNSLEQISAAMKEQLAAKPGVTPVEDGAFTVGAWKTHRFVYDVKSPNNVTTRAIQFVMVKDASVYVIALHIPPDKFDKAAEERAFELCGTFKLGADAGAGGAVSAKPDQGTAFESKEFGFSLVYPTTWTKQNLDQKGVALALARRASAGKVPQILMVMADTLDPDEKPDLKEMETKLIGSTQASLKDGKVIEAVDSQLGGEAARRVVLGGERVADQHQGRVILTFCLRGRSTIGLMAGGPVEDFEAVKADVEKIVGSFKFAGAAGVEAAGKAADAKPAPAPEAKTATHASAAPATFNSPATGVKLTYPGSWTAHQSSDPSIVLMLLSTPSRKGARASTILLTSEAVPAGTRANIRTQGDIAVAGAKASLSDAKVIEAADVKVGTEKGRRLVIEGHAAVGKAEMKSIYLLFQHGGDILTLSGQASAEDFDGLKEAFDGMVSSMELAVPALKK